ncbi:MAG: folylpolyglutamate synthase/dihydrofolate synthase family protein [candidate division WOR-3 bacterium]
MRFSDAVAFLDGLVNYEKQAKPRDRFKLDNIRRLLGLAGNPQERLDSVVLVAGTKGKGSVCYMLDAALRGCGLRTGLFVSPHVHNVRERIQYGGRPVAPAVFGRLVERFVPLVRRQPVSYFELTTAMAFALFARRQPDYSIIEVGLGGRLDATNLSEPKVSVITRIGLDHVKVLGSTRRQIAREKAGIMRPGRPVVIGRQEQDALAELRRCARACGALLTSAEAATRIGRIRLTRTGTCFSAGTDMGRADFRLPLLGRHQVENCQTALAVLGLLAKDDTRIRLAGVRRGLAKVMVPARCQVVSCRPFVMVDSCHNPDSGRALARVIRDHLNQRVILVYGSLRGKLVKETVRPLTPWIHSAVLVQPDSPRALPLAELSRIFTRLRVSHVTADNVPAAISLVRNSSLPVVFAGSFYLAGEVLHVLGLNRNQT